MSQCTVQRITPKHALPKAEGVKVWRTVVCVAGVGEMMLKIKKGGGSTCRASASEKRARQIKTVNPKLIADNSHLPGAPATNWHGDGAVGAK